MELLMSFGTLTVLEIVLGVDNLIFLAILANRLPPGRRERARRLGLLGAFATRIGLLFAISWVVGLTAPLFAIAGHAVTGKALVLLAGGGFLVVKAARELRADHHNAHAPTAPARASTTFASVIAQAMVLDVVFSLDSVITAVGMTDQIGIMIAANVAALAVMLALGGRLATAIAERPSLKVLALAFLLAIGGVLVAEGCGLHVPKSHVYAALGFAGFVEIIRSRQLRAAR